MTVTLPDDLAASLRAEAERQGTTAEELALRSVRNALPAQATPNGGGGTLYDLLKDHIGLEGDGQPWSIDCGRKFAEDLAAGRRARP